MNVEDLDERLATESQAERQSKEARGLHLVFLLSPPIADVSDAHVYRRMPLPGSITRCCD